MVDLGNINSRGLDDTVSLEKEIGVATRIKTVPTYFNAHPAIFNNEGSVVDFDIT